MSWRRQPNAPCSSGMNAGLQKSGQEEEESRESLSL